VEIFAERFILHRIPADANAETESTPAQNIQGCRLLGHEHRLTLRQDNDPCDQLDFFRQRGKIAKKHKRLMKLIPM
jgi:hypothetical protein